MGNKKRLRTHHGTKAQFPRYHPNCAGRPSESSEAAAKTRLFPSDNAGSSGTFLRTAQGRLPSAANENLAACGFSLCLSLSVRLTPSQLLQNLYAFIIHFFPCLSIGFPGKSALLSCRRARSPTSPAAVSKSLTAEGCRPESRQSASSSRRRL